MTGCHNEQKNQPGNWKIGRNTPQAMGKDVLGTFMHHPGALPVGPKMGVFGVKKQIKQTI